MKIGSCLTLHTESEVKLLREVVGSDYWNDHENIHCVPMKSLDSFQQIDIMSKFNLTVDDIWNIDYIVAEGAKLDNED